MKYHLIYPNINTGYFNGVHHGLAQLISILKKNNHGVSLQHISKIPNKKQLLSVIEKEKPDMIGFTVIENQLGFVRQWVEWIKQDLDIPIVCGGVYATLNPEELLSDKNIDYVCVGEGDKAILNKNYWFKHNGGIAHGIPYKFENLDDLPFPDYDLFNIEQMIKQRNGEFAIQVSRGCPYQCSNCSNEALKEAQKGLGQYFHYRSVKNTLDMVEYYKGRYNNINHITFADDVFGINKEWAFDFCEQYRKRFKISFDCNLRVEMVTEELLRLLKGAGCNKVEMGIESGNEYIRNEILNRKMTNQQIINAFENAHKVGLMTRAYNMVGLPYETPERIKETIELNKKIKPDEVAVFYFYPYKGTKLYDICKEEGLLSNKQTTNYVDKSILNMPQITQYQLSRLYNEFYRFVINQQLKDYPIYLRVLYLLVCYLLEGFTMGNEIRIIRKMYIKMANILKR